MARRWGRGLLQGRLVRDADVVEGDAAALARTAAERLGGTASVHPPSNGRTHPVVRTRAHRHRHGRTEHYLTPASLPVVSPVRLSHDLHRRDFTINSTVVCPHSARLGEVLDPFDGLQDPLRQRSSTSNRSRDDLHAPSVRLVCPIRSHAER